MSDARTHRIMERRAKMRKDFFTEVVVDGCHYHIPKPGFEKIIAASWKDHGICPECHKWSIQCGRCGDCGWTSTERKERDAALLAAKVKREQEITDAIAEYEEEQAALAAKRRK